MTTEERRTRRWSASPTVAGTLAVLRLLPAVDGAKTVLLAAGVLAATALPLAATVVTGLLVGSVPAAVKGGLASAAGHIALSLLAAVGLLIVVERLLGPFLAALAAAFGREVDRHLQERLMTAVCAPSGVAHLEDPAVLDLIENARGIGGEGERRPGADGVALASLLPSWLQALGSALILVLFHWWLALLWVVMWPVVTYLFQREYIRVGEVAAGQAGALRRADYYRALALAPAAAKEARIWGLTDWLVGRFEETWRRTMEPTWRARGPGRPVVWLSVAAVTAVNLASFGLLAWAAARGEIGLAALTVYTQALLAANGFRAFDNENTDLAYAAISVPSLLALEQRLTYDPGAPGRMQYAPTNHTRPQAADGLPCDHADQPPTSADVPVWPGSRGPLVAVPAVPATVLPTDSPRASIRFEGVSLRYPGRSSDALAGLDLCIPAGQSLAIVGLNGAGKTSLVKLLCRLYEPTAGRITVDGIALRDVDARAWQRRVAAIFQDFAQYHLPARDNVGLGCPALSGDEERLRAAARRAGALELIDGLPRGWDTVLSRQYTNGTDLSGGEWQRVALARALFAVEGGARVLILDEPTASLDVRAEAALYDRFLDITAGLTTILISHRFSTVRRADRICVLADGAVAEQGTHDELMALGGRYAEMFTLQATRFADEARESDVSPSPAHRERRARPSDPRLGSEGLVNHGPGGEGVPNTDA